MDVTLIKVTLGIPHIHIGGMQYECFRSRELGLACANLNPLHGSFHVDISIGSVPSNFRPDAFSNQAINGGKHYPRSLG